MFATKIAGTLKSITLLAIVFLSLGQTSWGCDWRLNEAGLQSLNALPAPLAVVDNADANNGGQIVLEQIVDHITTGIHTGSKTAAYVIENDPRSVDLTVLIANHIDNELMDEDAYWQYYLHCDQWNVVLGDKPELDLCVADVPASGSLLSGLAKVAEGCLQSIEEQIRFCEFLYVERAAELSDFVETLNVADAVETAEIADGVAESVNRSDEGGLFRILESQLNQRWQWSKQLISSVSGVSVGDLLDQWFCDPRLHAELDSDYRNIY